MRTTKEKIEDWVRENFGDSEVEDPSWNIDLLAEYLDSEKDSDLKYVGGISVDSGTIMVGDACYWLKGDKSMKWEDYCQEIGTDSVHRFAHESGIDGKGICFGNFGGDGFYAVYVELDDEGFQKRIIIDTELPY